MIVIPFEPVHVLDIDLQPIQKNAVTELPAQYLFLLKAKGQAFTAMHGNKVIACGGIVNADVPTLWGYISKDSKSCFIGLHRIVKRLLSCQLQPITAMVITDFPAGCRWLDLLGFKNEGIVKMYGLNGEDHYRYVWQPQ